MPSSLQTPPGSLDLVMMYTHKYTHTLSRSIQTSRHLVYYLNTEFLFPSHVALYPAVLHLEVPSSSFHAPFFTTFFTLGSSAKVAPLVSVWTISKTSPSVSTPVGYCADVPTYCADLEKRSAK